MTTLPARNYVAIMTPGGQTPCQHPAPTFLRPKVQTHSFTSPLPLLPVLSWASLLERSAPTPIQSYPPQFSQFTPISIHTFCSHQSIFCSAWNSLSMSSPPLDCFPLNPSLPLPKATVYIWSSRYALKRAKAASGL